MANRLTLRQRLAYALPAVPLTVVGLPLFILVPRFYSDVVGVDVATVGIILLLARLFDAVTDPLFGLLSDANRSRWGRRRVFLFTASLPLAAAVFCLLVPPEWTGQPAVVWFAVTVFLVYLFWTAVVVPYEALGIEISYTYDERTVVMGLREGFAILGLVAAVVSPPVIAAALGLESTPAGERQKFFVYALVYGPLLVICCWVCASSLRERPRPQAHVVPLSERLRGLAANRPFVVLLIAFALGSIGSTLPATLIMYYIPYVFESDSADLFLMLYILAGVAGVPLWIKLATRLEKKTAWMCAMGLHITAYTIMFFLGPGDEAPFTAAIIVAGLPVGALLALPPAMHADVVDLGERMAGIREEGLYVGVWNIAGKMMAAIATGASLSILGVSGYEPNVPQTGDVKTTLRVLYCVVPSVFSAIAVLVLVRYRIDRSAHREIRADYPESP